MSPLVRLESATNDQQYSGGMASSLDLLVLQPTPFCNIDCDYCYLPDRNDSQRMSLETLEAIIRMLIDSSLIDGCLSIAWHAGEPLTVPPSYYDAAFQKIGGMLRGRCEVSHCFQTSGTLINETWCEFFKSNNVRIGISVDGPDFIHDLHRKTRAGGPTHAITMRGVEKLRKFEIPFHAIAVITSDALDHADDIFNFFNQLGATEVGFNIEELEGNHQTSSLHGTDRSAAILKFWRRLYELSLSSESAVPIRELRRAAQAILRSKAHLPWPEIAKQNHQVLPLRIISVDCHGRYSTFSPELLGVKDTVYFNFVFGVGGRDSLADINNSIAFRRVANAVQKGVRACSLTCEYFSVCGGGAPANKYFENHDFASTQTMYCQASIQIPIQVVLEGFEKQLLKETTLFQTNPHSRSAVFDGLDRKASV